MLTERIQGVVSQSTGQGGGKEDHRFRPHPYFPKSEKKDLPKIPLPRPVTILLGTPYLWLEKEGVKYTPSRLVKSLFVRKDGHEIDKKRISVFFADIKSRIADIWEITPRLTWNKQKHQYWDKDFVRALFTYVALCEESDWGNVNKIAYKIRGDITFEEMQDSFFRANNEAIRVGRTL